MTPERWRQVEDVYHAVLARPAGERAGVAAELCAGDEVLRHEVESLLAHSGEASAFLETPAFAAASVAGEGPLIGRRFGPYQVRSLLGAGGMGEVYRAHDGQLGREVAIKILPRLFSSDPERLARFEAEARMLAALNHPHIGAIYRLEHVDGSPALVLELVEGETLAEQIARGPLPLAHALTIARQIADALEAAHERGIVHRDLKPANIKVTPDGVVKVLDFGLAKLGVRDVGGPGPELANSPTMIGTREGVILGSAAYMSPEQARGAAVDKRTDIWAFGCVLYEMLTGSRAFGGDALSDTLAAVLKDEPDLNRVPAPARVLVRRCLEKDPKRRLRDIGDALPLLETVPEVGLIQRVDRRSIRVAATVAAICLIGALAIAVVHFGEQPPLLRPVHFQVQTPETGRFEGYFALSPNGRMMAFIAMVADEPHMWVHSFETGQSRPLLNAGSFSNVMFWSPDSRFLAFPIEGKLKKISIVGEQLQTVCDLPPGSTYGGGAWNAQNVIVFGGSAGLMQVPAEGGVATPVTVLDRSRGDMGHPGPRFLPDGRHLLYFRNSVAETRGIYVASLDVKPDAQSLARIVASVSRPIYAAAGLGSGHLLFLREQTLFAQPFDPEELRLTGEAFVVAENVGLDLGIALGWISATPEGTLAYRGAVGMSGAPIWVTRAGVEVVTIGAEIREPRNPRLSPDGKRLVLVAADDLWEYDLHGRPPVKLTAESRVASPLWTPDGKSLVYESGNATSLRIIPAAAGATAQPASPKGHYHPHGWSPDGQDLIVAQLAGGETGWDIVRFAPDVKSQPQFVVKTPATEGVNGMAPSPNGRWLAYVSDTTGRAELWVQSVPEPGSPVRVSSRGGAEPVWARNCRELYYLEGNKLMAVAVSAGAKFNFKPPALLFEFRYQRSRQPPSYDVGPDGRFLVIKASNATRPPITVISNWGQTVASSR